MNDLADMFWELSNLIAGFAGAQMVASLLAIGSQKDLQLGLKAHQPILMGALILFNCFYIVLVIGCYYAEHSLRSSASGEILSMVYFAMWGRVVWIVFFLLFGLFAFCLIPRPLPGQQ